MINIFFKSIRLFFYKNNLPKFISFYNLNKYECSKIKNITVWLMCTAKKKSICKKCNSCIGFKKNTHYDYFESKDGDIFLLEKFLKNKPIFSNIKVVHLFLNDKNKKIIKFIENNFNSGKIYFVIFFYTNYLKMNDFALNFYNKNKNYLISISVIKFIYKKILNKNLNFFIYNFLNINNIIIIDSLIYFFKFYLNYNFFKKKKILMNNNVKNKIIKKNIFFLLNVLEKYKKKICENNNLNVLILMNFIIDYIND